MNDDPLLKRRIWKLSDVNSGGLPESGKCDTTTPSSAPSVSHSLGGTIEATGLFSAPATADDAAGEESAGGSEPLSDELISCQEREEFTASAEAAEFIAAGTPVPEPIAELELSRDPEESVATRVFDVSRDDAHRPATITPTPHGADIDHATGLFDLSEAPDRRT